YNKEPERHVKPDPLIEVSDQLVDLVICEAKSKGKQLQFNRALVATPGPIECSLRWAGMFQETDIAEMAHHVQSALVLRPHDCVIECPPGFLAGKIPLDHDLIAIRATVPSSRFPPQRGAISDPAATQALPGVQADGDLCLVQPTAMLRGVVHREPLPQPLALLRAETLDDRLASVRTQIIHDQ